MLDQNLVEEAAMHLSASYDKAVRALGGTNNKAVVYEYVWRISQTTYKLHLFGGDGYRGDLYASIHGHVKILGLSTKNLGIEHPTTLEMWASLQLCFEEQLDWTLDDIPREHIDALDEIPRPAGHKVFWK